MNKESSKIISFFLFGNRRKTYSPKNKMLIGAKQNFSSYFNSLNDINKLSQIGLQTMKMFFKQIFILYSYYYK